MPAETHQHREHTDAGAVLDFLATVVEVDPAEADEVRLADIGLDDDLSILRLWDMAVEEFAERTVGDVDPDDLQRDLDADRPATLAELAQVFDEALRR
ncbi:MAG TPA: hypothetical protein VIL48_02010 [Acidimicrobiales bacterium]